MIRKITFITLLSLTSLSFGQSFTVLKSKMVASNDCTVIGGITNTDVSTMTSTYDVINTTSEKYFVFQVKTSDAMPVATSISDLISYDSGSTNFTVTSAESKQFLGNGGCGQGVTAGKEMRFIIEYTPDYVIGVSETVTFNLANLLTGMTSHAFSLTVNIIEDPLASVNALEQFDFHFGPVPSSDHINVSANTAIDTARIVNVHGQTVLSAKIDDKTSAVDISNLPNGIYVLQVSIGDTTGSYQFIKS